MSLRPRGLAPLTDLRGDPEALFAYEVKLQPRATVRRGLNIVGISI